MSSDEHIQRANMAMRQATGLEMTPDEFKENLTSAYAKIRAEMRKKGHVMPDSDEKLGVMLYAAYAEERKQQETFARMKVKLDEFLENLPPREPTPHVVTYNGSVVAKFTVIENALLDATMRNEKAIRLGVKARYKVEIHES